MSEHETRLRRLFGEVSNDVGSEMARELDAALSRARAEALQEVVDVFGTWKDSEPAEVVRRMMETPAPASIPVERVRKVLAAPCKSWERMGLGEAARRLGVPLDAAQAKCRVCEEPEGKPHKMSCRPQNREDAARHAAQESKVCTCSRGGDGTGLHGPMCAVWP